MTVGELKEWLKDKKNTSIVVKKTSNVEWSFADIGLIQRGEPVDGGEQQGELFDEYENNA